MAKWDVRFEVRKGNSVTEKGATVEADSERVAIQLAETKAKSATTPVYRNEYEWKMKSIKKK